MKRLLSIPLRVILPMLLLSCAVAAGLVSWKLNVRLLTGEIEAQFLDDARLGITGLQATLEYLFRKDDANGVRLQVSGLATRNDVVAAFVLDRQDHILAATRAGAIGNDAEATLASLPAELQGGHAARIAQVRTSPHGIMALSRDRRFAVAYYPLLVDVDRHALRSSQNGLVMLVFDTQFAKGRAFQAAGRQALGHALVFAGLAVCGWVFIHFSLTRRVAGLVTTTRQLASGDLTARTGIVGNDELGQVAGAIDSMAGRIAGDILRQKQIEAKLRESEERFRQFAENIKQVFWMGSPHGGELLYVSPAYEQLWGRTCASAYAEPQSWMEAIVPEDRPRVQAGLVENANGKTFDIEYRVIRPDGSRHWMHDRGFPVRDQAGKVVRVCGIVDDITERKRSEAALEEAHRELIDTSRLAGMAEVATGVLHNVGNVLNSVNVSATLVIERVKKSKSANVAKLAALLDEQAPDLAAFVSRDPRGKQLPAYVRQLAGRLGEEQQEVVNELDLLVKNIEHIKDIVAMQQSYGKMSGVSEVLDVTDLVEDSLRMNATSLTRHEVQVIREFQPVPSISLEKHKVLQILVNLIRNAKQACEEAAGSARQLTLRIANGDGSIKISVSDNGIGIPAENLARIFNHGFTTKKEGHGFGLHSGVLAAREMGGDLHVGSEGAGRGATFTLELPCQNL